MLIELLVTLAMRLHLYLPVPEDTALTPEKVQIGTRLFVDRRAASYGVSDDRVRLVQTTP
jgi:hypothetical protein